MHCIVPNGWANERWVSLPQTTCTDSRILFSQSLSAHSNAAIFAHSPHFTLSHSLLPCHTLGPYVPYALWYLLSHIECWRAQFIAAQLAALAHIWHMYVNKRQSTGGVSNYWWKIPWTALFLIFARSPSSAVCVTTSSEKLWVGVLAQKNWIIIEKKYPKESEWERPRKEKMPSQEEIRICEPADDLNHIFSYESDLKSQFYPSLCHQNGLVKPPSSQLNEGFPRADNYTSHKSTHQLNSEAVCTMCPS